jgi:hypothetical protein
VTRRADVRALAIAVSDKQGEVMNRRMVPMIFVALFASPAFAEDWPTEPREIVAKIYALSACKSGKYDCPSAFDDKQIRSRYFSASLDGVIRKAYAKSKRTNEPVIDFDPVMNTQEQADPKNLAFDVETSVPDKTTVAARWDESGSRVTVRYIFVREKGSWRIDEMRGGVGGKDTWSLRRIAAGG